LEKDIGRVLGSERDIFVAAVPFMMDENGHKQSLGWVRSGGSDIHPLRKSTSAMLKGIFIVKKDGHVRILPTADFDSTQFPADQWPEGFQAGPMAVINGKLNPRIEAWHSNLLAGRKVVVGVDRAGNVHVLDLFGIDIFGRTGPTAWIYERCRKLASAVWDHGRPFCGWRGFGRNVYFSRASGRRVSGHLDGIFAEGR